MNVALILDLVDALGGAHNEASCARAAAATIARYLPLVQLTLVLRASDAAAAPSSDARRQVVADVVARKKPALRRSEATEMSAPLGGTATLEEVRFVFSAGAPPSAALVRALGRVLGAALRQVRTIARVADVSRLAHVRSRELGASLREFVPEELVATSPVMRRIAHEIIPAVAARSTCVLVQGETGTGKELLVRRIHELS